MEEATSTGQAARFEGFELDLRAAELRKEEVNVRLPEQPFRILTILLERAGEAKARKISL